MSATAFQRHRREQAKKLKTKKSEQAKDNNSETVNLAELSIEDLKAYATQNGVDIGNASSAKGIIKKIKATQDGGEADGEE